MEILFIQSLFTSYFTQFVSVWIGIALLLFPVLLFVKAPYGRHSSKKWGKQISNRWGWFIMEVPSLLFVLYFTIWEGDLSNKLVLSASILWIAHYFHRSIIFPIRIHTTGKKMPLAIMFMALFFNLVNGSINGFWIGNLAPDFAFEGIYLVRFVLGVIIFCRWLYNKSTPR